MSLNIKDGNGSSQTLKTSLDAGDLVPHHIVDGTVTVSASLSNPIPITGTIAVTSSLASPLYVTTVPVTTVTKTATTSFTWSTAASGTFNLVSESVSRKGLTIFNPGPNNLYIAFSTAGDTTHGFTLTNTSSAPSNYSFILYPSGTYVSEPTTVGVYHGGYFVSGSSSIGVFATSIS